MCDHSLLGAHCCFVFTNECFICCCPFLFNSEFQDYSSGVLFAKSALSGFCTCVSPCPGQIYTLMNQWRTQSLQVSRAETMAGSLPCGYRPGLRVIIVIRMLRMKMSMCNEYIFSQSPWGSEISKYLKHFC